MPHLGRLLAVVALLLAGCGKEPAPSTPSSPERPMEAVQRSAVMDAWAEEVTAATTELTKCLGGTDGLPEQDRVAARRACTDAFERRMRLIKENYLRLLGGAQGK